MSYDLQNDKQIGLAKKRFETFLRLGKVIELKEVKKTRTNDQNSALHLYFKLIAYQLNELGLEFHYQGLNIQGLTSRYTENIIKEFIWRPIQISLFNIKSTTKLDTRQINEIIDVITKFFGDRGVFIEFPSIETLTKKNINKKK